jgi:hypothetical protein
MRFLLPALATCLALGCNADPGYPDQGVAFRDNTDPGPSSGERGTVVVSEVLWSGTVDANGVRDQSDVFIELRNEGNRPLNLSRWFIMVSGAVDQTWRIPDTDRLVQVGEHVSLAARDDRCLLSPDFVIDGLVLPDGDPLRIVLKDADERLIEPMGNDEQPAFAGGWDGKESRSMERVELMFGGRGSDPHSWHFYTRAEVDVPNNDRLAEGCQAFTLASPGRPNSPDYSGAYAAGALE